MVMHVIIPLHTLSTSAICACCVGVWVCASAHAHSADLYPVGEVCDCPTEDAFDVCDVIARVQEVADGADDWEGSANRALCAPVFHSISFRDANVSGTLVIGRAVPTELCPMCSNSSACESLGCVCSCD